MENGEVEVVERIEVDFKNLEKHGIFREIPYIYKNQDGSSYYTEVKIQSVNQPYETSTRNGNIILKIGDPDRTVSGKQTYEIRYIARGVLVGFSGYDEFYWNTTGNNWEVPIEKATVSVTLPSPKILNTACYVGVALSTQSCAEKESTETTATFAADNLVTGEGLTVAVGYTAGLVPLIAVPKPKTAFDVALEPINIAIGVIVLLFGLFSVFYLWVKKGRDFWTRQRFLDDPNARKEVMPLSGRETVVVEFSSPESLRPGEIGALMDQTADTLDITATIVDLANRGFLTVTEVDKKWVFGSKDYILKSTAKDKKDLFSYEEELLDRLFDEGEEVKLSGLKNKFYKDLAKVKDKLTAHMVEKKYFVENPNNVRAKYSGLAVVVLLAGAGAIWLGVSQKLGFVLDSGVAIVPVGIVFLVFAQVMPRRSAEGRSMYVRSQGYKMFIERAEKYRQQFFEKKNLFNEVLPYAIVFGVTEKFARAFAQMGLETQSPSWYHGHGVFAPAVFAASMNSFSSSVSSAMASAPSSSGSGGGGSSGGGFGGGGGGSW